MTLDINDKTKLILTNCRETVLLLIHKCAIVAVLDIVTRPLSFQLLAHILFHLFISFSFIILFVLFNIIQCYSFLFILFILFSGFFL